MSVDLAAVERTMRVLAERSQVAFAYHDPANGQVVPVAPEALAARTGYLPAIVSAAEAIWREAAGTGFQLDIVGDQAALLGYRLRGIGAGSFSTVMLASMEALHQAARPGAIILSDLNAVWTASTERARVHETTPAAPRNGPRP